MQAEQVFLKAVLADPDNDAPRLAFGRWLEQQANPRGEFIRVQCRLEQIAQIDKERPQLEERARELLLDHQTDWLEPIHQKTKLPRTLLNVWTFKRGFLDEIGIDPGDFLEQASALLALEPIRVVRLIRVRNRQHLGDRGAIRLAELPEVARLRMLHINDHEIGAAGARALAASPHLAQLAAFILDGCKLDGDALDVLKKQFGFRLFIRRRDQE